MLLHANVSCPQCQGSACRESKWRSHGEKLDHPGCRPYRCLACSHRFVAPEAARPARKGLLLAAAAAVFVVLAGGLASLTSDWSPHPPEAVALAPAPPADTAADAPTVATPDLRQAAEGGDIEAQYRVGRALMFDSSKGRAGSEEAVKWLQKAADGGHTGAMIQLGKLYRVGVGVLQNFELSLNWIRAAASHGDAEGMMELGRLYRSGVGVEQNLIDAYVWFNRAAAAHNLDAARERENIALKLTPEQLKAAQNRSVAAEPEEKTAAAGEPK